MMILSEPTTFIACLDCRVLEPDGEAAGSRPSRRRLVEVAEKTTDGFLHAHSRHHTARLERRELDLCSDQRWWQRNAADSFAATDGEHLYVVTGSRPDDGRILYRLRPATLQPKESALAVDEETVRRGLVSALFPYRLRPNKFRRFMAALHGIIRGLSTHQLDLIFEAADDPSIGIARMPDSAYVELRSLCANLFDPWELPRIEHFLERDRQQEGLLALRVRRELAALDA